MDERETIAHARLWAKKNGVKIYELRFHTCRVLHRIIFENLPARLEGRVNERTELHTRYEAWLHLGAVLTKNKRYMAIV